jgi:hypothetical protein
MSRSSASQQYRPIPPAGPVLRNRHSCSAGEAVDLPSVRAPTVASYP